jgi:hypothetical protein
MLRTLSNVVGGLGVLLCVVAVLVRVAGIYHLAGFESVTLFNAGIAGMVLGCLLKLEVLLHR